MKSKRALLVSLMLGLFAVMIVHLYLAKKESDLRAGSTPQAVYMALDDIPEMVRIEVGMVQRVEIPAAYVQPQATTDLDQIIGSVARVPIFKGSQITRNVLLSRIETGLAMRVDPTRRAMAIAVTDVTGVAGLIQPGNRVDIFGTYKLNRGDHETVQSHMLLPNVKVLAVERRIGAVAPDEIMSQEEHKEKERSGDRNARKDEYPKNITISVTPQEAVRLITAQEAGFLTVLLRAQFDESPDEPVPTVNTQDLIGVQEKTAPQRVPRYEEIRGNEVSY